MRIALYQPDIAPNAGAIMRLGACLGVGIDLIEPAGFVLSDRRLKRAGMDYLEQVELSRHRSWDAFLGSRGPGDGRLVLLTTRATTPYIDYKYRPNDVLLVGRETGGVPDDVHESVDARVIIPMWPRRRSLNVAQAVAMVLGEALRQTGEFYGELE